MRETAKFTQGIAVGLHSDGLLSARPTSFD
jgi:hypothetical protein